MDAVRGRGAAVTGASSARSLGLFIALRHRDPAAAGPSATAGRRAAGAGAHRRIHPRAAEAAGPRSSRSRRKPKEAQVAVERPCRRRVRAEARSAQEGRSAGCWRCRTSSRSCATWTWKDVSDVPLNAGRRRQDARRPGIADRQGRRRAAAASPSAPVSQRVRRRVHGPEGHSTARVNSRACRGPVRRGPAHRQRAARRPARARRSSWSSTGTSRRSTRSTAGRCGTTPPCRARSSSK